MDHEGNSSVGKGGVIAGFNTRSHGAQVHRKPRPSKARGLRTSTGCLTCRRRRVKCDELRPKCSQCLKSPHRRQCEYENSTEADPSLALESYKETIVDSQQGRNHAGATINPQKINDSDTRPRAETSKPAEKSNDAYQSGQTANRLISLSPNISDAQDQSGFILSGKDREESPEISFELDIQASTRDKSISSVENEAPFNWYELLANDALGNFEKYSFLSHESRWEFNPAALLQQPSSHFRSISHGTATCPEIDLVAGGIELENSNNPAGGCSTEPWNSVERLKLEDRETFLFQYFLEIIGPLLDLFDPTFHFSNHVPHLAMYNTGLMKSMLAVAAIHRSLGLKDHPSSVDPPSPNHQPTPDSHLATKYYYETLNYLSQAMPYQTYAHSSEILATAILLGTYEMFDGSNRNWERHLKGTFWILRTQDIDGESLGLRRAAWWAWLRQDVWAAFRDKRRTLTIWQPTRLLDSLSGSDLACRSLYLLSKAVEYSSDVVKKSQDLVKRLDEGNLLICALDEWKNALPRSFFSLPVPKDSRSHFEPIQIHPPAYAAAMQTYSFAKIIIVLNMPSSGGVNEYHERQKTIDLAVNLICGIALSPKSREIPLAFVSAQCLFAAGQCIRSVTSQTALLEILEESIDICKWPPKTIIAELKAVWQGS